MTVYFKSKTGAKTERDRLPEIAPIESKPQQRKTKNNEYEFTKLTAHQNDEPNQNQAKMNLHPAKRALAGFASQIQKHAVHGMFVAN